MIWAGRLRLAAVLAFREARGSPRGCALEAFSLALAVAGMLAMQLVAFQLSEHAASNSRQWIAADAALELEHPLNPEQWSKASGVAPHIRLTVVTELPAMAVSTGAADAVAVQLKAVDPSVYPFYGSLDLKSGRRLKSSLDAESAIVSQELLAALQERIGGVIRIRDADFRIGDVIATEPDRFAGPYSAAPRVIVSSAGLNRTGLLRFSDSAFYHVLFQIPLSENVVEICRRIEKLFPYALVRDYTTPMPMVSVTADWIVPFLRVVAMLALAFGTGAIAALSYVYLLQKLDTIAILKALGGPSALVIDVFVLRTLGLAFIGSSLGLLGGWLIQRVDGSIVLQMMGIHLDSQLPAAVIVQTLVVAMFAAMAAAGGSLRAARSVRPGVLLRRDTGEKELLIRNLSRRARPGLGQIAGLLLPAILLLCGGDSWRTWIVIVALSAGVAAVILVCVRCAAALFSQAGRGGSSVLPFPMRHGFENARRYASQTRGALLVLVGAVALILMAGIGRRQIADLVIDSLPLGAHNLVFFNVDSADAAQLSAIVKTQRGFIGPPTLVPSALLTVARVDGYGLDALRATQSRSWIHKVWPATCSDEPPQSVRILSGKWWTADSPVPPVALEQNAADLLRAHVGSRIDFLVDGKPLPTQVGAIIRVPPLERYWYRLTLGCRAFAGLPVNMYSGGISVETSRLPELRRLFEERLHRAAVVDVSAMKQQAERVGAEAIHVLTVAAALLACVAFALLLTAIAALGPFRVYEIAILRSLGASSRTLLSALAVEYAALGAIAGLIGAPLGLLGANLILWYVTGRFTWIFDVPTAILAMGAATLLVSAIGVAGSRGLLQAPPLEILRRR